MMRQIPKNGFWILTDHGFKKVRGMKVSFSGYEGFDFFIHVEKRICLNLSEGKTGMMICQVVPESTAKGIEEFTKKMTEEINRRSELEKCILEVVERGEISPRWKQEGEMNEDLSNGKREKK